MSRAFFEEVGLALRGFLPRALRDPHTRVASGGLKVWYASAHEHYEVQLVPGAVIRAARAGTGPALEIGFHAEHPRPEHNDDALAAITAGERAWRRALGRTPVAGPFVGRPEQRARWRRVSELWDDVTIDEDGAAVEAAERAATYIRSFEPLVVREPRPRCACWTASG